MHRTVRQVAARYPNPTGIEAGGSTPIGVGRWMRGIPADLSEHVRAPNLLKKESIPLLKQRRKCSHSLVRNITD